MKRKLIIHIFAVVQNLEKRLEETKAAIKDTKGMPMQMHFDLVQQEDVVKHMRRTANRLQLELAREDWIAIIRTLQIFYGLNHMVRPEVMGTYSSIVKGQNHFTSESAAPRH